MSNSQKMRDKKIFDILLILKCMYIVLCIVSIVSHIELSMNIKDIVSIMFYGSAFLILMILYFYFMLNTQSKNKQKSYKYKSYIETSILLLIFIVVLIGTGVHKSPYKFMALFVILIGCIQFGANYSIGVSIACAIIILGIDCIGSLYIGNEGSKLVNLEQITSISQFIDVYKPILSEQFEIDMILISGLIVTAFILGMYVDIEKEHGLELSNLANIDELTGLYNHRYFQEFLNDSLNQSDKYENGVSLLFMDIDHFKHYNDLNGHQAGDLVLAKTGIILKQCIRDSDIVARYGGEEFAAILPNTKEEDAIKVGERIRDHIESTYFDGQENQPGENMTISIGVSSYPKRAKTKYQLINTADDALYRAKAFNKNRVEVYENIIDNICTEMSLSEEISKQLRSFINAINEKDRYTYGHTERVVIYSKWFSDYLNLNEKEKYILRISSYLHDIGKLEIKEDVLNKKDKLTEDEFNVLKQHPSIGVDMIKDMHNFKECIPIIKHHHERYDGRGYPDALKGEEIPYLSRIITIVDSFDAMTSNRPYNKRKSHEEGIKELRRNSGTQFDPELVDKFIEMIEKQKY